MRHPLTFTIPQLRIVYSVEAVQLHIDLRNGGYIIAMFLPLNTSQLVADFYIAR